MSIPSPPVPVPNHPSTFPKSRHAGRSAGRLRAAAGLAVLVGSAGFVGLTGLWGCTSPLSDRPERELRRSVREAVQRELAESADRPERFRLQREDRVGQLGIDAPTLQKLEEIAGPGSYSSKIPPLGVTLYGDEQQTVAITLQQVVMTTAGNNLNVEFARLAPAINQQQLAAAEAVFDWTFFTNTQYNNLDQPRTSSAVGGFQSSVNRNTIEQADVTAGLRKPLISGGQVQIQTQYNYTDNNTPGLTVSPNPAYDTNLVVQVNQSLLRNFGSDVALANVRLARNAELDSIHDLKRTLIESVTQAETAYWNLVRAQADLKIINRLLERGEETLRTLEARQGFDAKPANLSNARSNVASRRRDLTQAQRVLRDASDRLKQVMNDPRLTVGGSEALLVPTDGPIEQAVEFSLYDALQAAIANRPEIQRAIISIDNTSIRENVADNARLPRLDVQALARINGLDRSPGQAYDRLGEAEFVDYQIQVQFEQPLGNRAAEAGFQQRRLERNQAVISLRNTTQGVALEVKSSLRDIQNNYALIEQSRAARVAAAADLRELEVAEQTIQSLTPEFLNLKFDRQRALAAAEQQEIGALIEYNTAIARYHQATGTALSRNQITFDVPSMIPDRRTSDLFPDYPAESQRRR